MPNYVRFFLSHLIVTIMGSFILMFIWPHGADTMPALLHSAYDINVVALIANAMGTLLWAIWSAD